MKRLANHIRIPVLSVLVLLSAQPGGAAIQAPGGGPPAARSGEQRTWYTLGRVNTLYGAPVPGAAVMVYTDASTSPKMRLETNYQGEFEISMKVEPHTSQRIRVVARQKGYLDAVEAVDMAPEKKPEAIELVLRRDSDDDDEDQLPFRTLVSSVADRLCEAAGPSRAGGDWKGTLQAARTLLKARNADGALQLLAIALGRDPNCIEFRTLHSLAMLDMGSWSGATRQLAETAALNASMEPGSRRAEPHLILGVLECRRGNPEYATDLFLRALDTGPPSPLLLQELGRAYLLQKDWSRAEGYFAQAIQAGCSPETRLLRAKALLAEAKPHDAQSELRTYLGARKPKDLANSARMTWIRLDTRLGLELESEANTSKSVVRQTPTELLESMPELQGLEPAKGQEELPAILEKIGEHVERFFRDFHNSISHEEVRQEALTRNGKVKLLIKQDDQYLLLTYPDSSQPGLEEYRTDRKGSPTAPGTSQEGFILTNGFASASAFLLPAYQPESHFAYLGRQRVDGHDTHVIAFAQRPEAARLLGWFRGSEVGVVTLAQGVVWVDDQTYQIARLRTDLLHPISRVRLDRETTEIGYSEVHFKDAGFSAWLPRDVVVTVEWKGKHCRNRHSYSDFHLFTVGSKILTSPNPFQNP
jgi:tetratricopeptide (TPR) repeat protein